MPDRVWGARERPLAPPASGGAAPHEGHQTLARPSHARGGCPHIAQPQREKQKVKPEFRQFHFPRATATRARGKPRVSGGLT